MLLFLIRLYFKEFRTILSLRCNQQSEYLLSMKKSALLETIKTFSKQELRDFGLFIQSPFFNTNQSVIKLYEQIKRLYPDFDEKQSDKKLLFSITFGKITYNDSFMRMTVFRLLELTKEYLIHRNLQHNELIKESLLLDELNTRELNNLMMKSISGLDKIIDSQKAKEAESYFVKYKLEYFKNDVKSRDTKFITYKDNLDEELMLEQKSLNAFFFISSLKFFQYYLNQKSFVVNTGGYPDFTNNILEYLKLNKEYLQIPVLKIYYYIVLMLSTKDDQYFFILKNILFEDKDNIGYPEKFNLIATLRNYAQRKFIAGNKDFKSSMIDIIKFSIEKDILTTAEGGKYISEMRFMNIAWAGIQSNELDWLEEFIKKYISRIEPDKRQYVHAYSIAGVEFEKGNFSGALERLSNCGPIKNVIYKAAIKQLTLMIYYELKWFLAAADLLDAFRHFLRTDKLLPEMYINNCNSFINYFGRLLKLNDNCNKGKDEFEITKLISELKLTSQSWLLKKASDLEIK